MLKRLVAFIRSRNRARLERRDLAKASGTVSGGWFARLTASIRERNHTRLASRRAQRSLLASIAANDTATLEALVFLLRNARQEQIARASAHEELATRLTAVEERIDAGLRLVTARLQSLETRLATSARAEEGVRHANVVGVRAASGGGVNGDLQRVQRVSVAEPQPDGLPAEASRPAGDGSRRA